MGRTPKKVLLARSDWNSTTVIFPSRLGSRTLLHHLPSSPFSSALWTYMLCVLYSGEFLGLCRHDPERRLQYSSVNLLIFFPGQQSTSILCFLDCLALLSKLSQIRLLIPGNSSQHDVLLQSFIFSACKHAVNVLQRQMQTQKTPGHCKCMC